MAFKPRLTKPEAGNKYYNTKGNGGYSDAIKGKPTDAGCDVLSNCVGYAYGRFNEIGGYGCCKYLRPTNAENFIQYKGNLEVGQTPKLGACMVWRKGASLNGSDGAGHVAIVEKIVSDTQIVTSESGWNSSTPFWTKTRNKGNGNWGAGSGYTFLGFIYNPAVKDDEKPTQPVDGKVSTGSASDEKTIWNFLKGKGLNDFAVAGVMGNLYAESALRSNNLQQSYERKLGYTDETYTRAVDGGSYGNFVKDSAGYGLAQWTYWSRKQGLLEYAKGKNKSIGDLTMQLEFLWKELQGYSAVMKVLKAATSVQEASDIFMCRFENPADQSASAKSKRASYGQKYYDKYTAKATAPTPESNAEIIHVVKERETLSKIAAMYKTTYQKLAQYNGISNPHLIHVGQEIRIPGAIKEGSVVRVKAGAKTYTGGPLASFVYKRDHEVDQISGDRVVITFGGTVVAAVNIKDLSLVK